MPKIPLKAGNPEEMILIKGCSKKVIVVKDTGSGIFEEAYFIVNPKETARKYSDFLAEANRIIASKTVKSQSSKADKKRHLFMLVLGFFIGFAVAIPVMCLVI